MRTICEIANEIYTSWVDKKGESKVWYGAVPYLQAMAMLETTEDMYFSDSAKDIVIYFLSNATTWRGEDARRIKAELKGMFGIK